MRGQAEIVGAVLAVAVFFAMFMFMFNFFMVEHNTSSHSAAVKRDLELQRSAEALSAYRDSGSLCLVNNGSVPVTIVRIWVDEGGFLNVFRPRDLGVDEPFTIVPGEEKCVNIDGSVVSIITSRGNIFTPRQLGLEAGRSGGSVVQVIGGGVVIGPDLFSPNGLVNASNAYYDQGLLREPTYSNIGSGRAYGMVRYASGNRRGGFVLVASFENAPIRFYSGGTLADIGSLFIGYQPGGKSSYNILVAGPGDDSLSNWRHRKKCGFWFFKKWCCEHEYRSNYHTPVLEVGGHKISLGEGLGASGWRVRIIGFHPYSFVLEYRDTLFGQGGSYRITDIRQALGYWWFFGGTTDRDRDYGDDRQIHARLYLYGWAERIEVYSESFAVQRTSYRPYVISGDYDGDGFPELVFTTEDTYPGGYQWYRSQPGHWVCSTCGYDGKCEDRFWYSLGVTSADEAGRYLDYSEQPLIIYFTKYPIDPKQTGMVELTAGVYFHMSDFCTGCQASDRPVLVFLLVDPGEDGKLATSDDKIVSKYSITLDKLREIQATTGISFLRAYPPEKVFGEIKVRMLLVNVNTDRELYIAIGFQDPFAGWGRDDADITVAVEPLTITFYAKS